ncbi:MAG TPA: 2-C-methyl-D-erythritol 4-phosphate cytidylyltransferase [Phycisphaerae bacterium]
MARVAVIIPAAGKSERFAGEEKKTFAKLDGRPIFLRSLELFINREDVCQTILVVSSSDLSTIKSQYGANLGFMGVQVVTGGEERYQSVAAALNTVREDADLVAIHDAVRPCVTPQMIDAVFAEAQRSGAAILAAPLTGTIKRVSAAKVVDATIDREGLYEAQTPQVFRRDLILAAYRKLPEGVTDDAQTVERQGQPVTVVLSDASNIKITTRADITLASAILKARPPARPTKAMGAFEEAQW